MAHEFLSAAELVLRLQKKPLLIQDIVQKGIDEGYLKTDGKTPLNTMRARLAENIKKYKEESTFLRVGPNKFALREWNDIIEYISKPLQKNRSNENVVCIRQDLVDKHKRFFGFSTNYQPILSQLKHYKNILLLNREEANRRTDIKQLVSYVILKDKKNRILSFVRGNYGQKESLLKGVLCIGFGGHVNSKDINDLFASDAGVKNSAYREIYEEIKGLKLTDLALIGIINDDSSPLGLNHLAFVYEAYLPTSFDIKSVTKEKVISKLRLLNSEELWESFHELEFWSQLVIKKLISKPRDISPVFLKSRQKYFNKSFLAIVGEIGSGKTEVSEYLSGKFNIPLLSTRGCVERLINLKDFRTNNRTQFQDKAKQLVSTASGIKMLADEIVRQANDFKKECVIIDGIRNLETYNYLRSDLPNLNLMYVDVPRDTAYRLFSLRSKDRNVSIHEFREARHHEVEKEITLFKTRADVYVFNGGTIKDLERNINRWWNERNKT